MEKPNTEKGLKAYRKLKEFILNYHIQPGQRLEHSYLSKEIGVSTTPIREALCRLVEEGYAFQIKNRGYFVSNLTLEEVEQIYEMREALEIFALTKTMALGELTEKKTLAKLKRLVSLHAEYARKESLGKRLALDQEIHTNLAGLSGNTLIASSVHDLYEKLNYKRRLIGLDPERGQPASIEHVRLVELIEKKDVEGAVKCLKEHINRGRERVITLLTRREANLQSWNVRTETADSSWTDDSDTVNRKGLLFGK